MIQHYNQEPKRKAEFMRPPNYLKQKVGSGGLGEDVLNKAQKLLENNSVDFLPLGETYLESLKRGIEKNKNAQATEDKEYLISLMIYPAMQLKANGGMFHYPMITAIADKLIQFLEVIDKADIEAMQIALAFHASMRAVLRGKIHGKGGKYGTQLLQALDSACMRYFDKYPELLRRA